MRGILAIVVGVSWSAVCFAQSAPPREFDARRAAAAGIRVLAGRHVQVLTDVPSSAAVDELPRVFDAAVPQWAAYFGVPAGEVRGRWLAMVIQDRARFAALNLLPQDNPEFINGYARGYELWLMEQPSDYYRRHLLLHEGTHAFMQTHLGGAGPGWYMEGMAELLGTHSWRDGRLELGVMPASRDDVPMWGRTKIVRDAVAAGKAWPLEAVLAVENRRPLSTDHYAWTWALATLLDGHPRFRERFRELKRFVADEAFTQRFRTALAADWDDLLAEWEAYVSQLDYGYDVPRMAMTHRAAEPGGIVGAAGRRRGGPWLAVDRVAAPRGSDLPGNRERTIPDRRRRAAVAVRGGRRDDRVPRRPAARGAARSAAADRRRGECGKWRRG